MRMDLSTPVTWREYKEVGGFLEFRVYVTWPEWKEVAR